MASFIAGILVGSLAAHAPAPELSDPDAQRHLRAGIDHFVAGDYAAAADALEAAYAIEPDPRVLAAWGRAELRAGDCDAAVDKLRRYLDTAPPPAGADEARAMIAECAEDPEAAPSEPAVSTPTTGSAGPIEAAPPSSDARPLDPPRPTTPATKPWSRDVLGGVLVGTGAAALATGLGLTIAAFVGQGRARDIDDHQDFVDAETRARTLERASFAMYGIGTALAVGGVVRWVIVGRRSRSARLSVGATPTMLMLRGAF